MKTFFAALLVFVASMMQAAGTDSVARRSFVERENFDPRRPAPQDSAETDPKRSVSHADRLAVQEMIRLETQDSVVGFLICQADKLLVFTGLASWPLEGRGEAFTVERRKTGWVFTSLLFGFPNRFDRRATPMQSRSANPHAVTTDLPQPGQ